MKLKFFVITFFAILGCFQVPANGALLTFDPDQIKLSPYRNPMVHVAINGLRGQILEKIRSVPDRELVAMLSPNLKSIYDQNFSSTLIKILSEAGVDDQMKKKRDELGWFNNIAISIDLFLNTGISKDIFKEHIEVEAYRFYPALFFEEFVKTFDVKGKHKNLVANVKSNWFTKIPSKNEILKYKKSARADELRRIADQGWEYFLKNFQNSFGDIKEDFIQRYFVEMVAGYADKVFGFSKGASIVDFDYLRVAAIDTRNDLKQIPVKAVLEGWNIFDSRVGTSFSRYRLISETNAFLALGGFRTGWVSDNEDNVILPTVLESTNGSDQPITSTGFEAFMPGFKPSYFVEYLSFPPYKFRGKIPDTNDQVMTFLSFIRMTNSYFEEISKSPKLCEITSGNQELESCDFFVDFTPIPLALLAQAGQSFLNLNAELANVDGTIVKKEERESLYESSPFWRFPKLQPNQRVELVLQLRRIIVNLENSQIFPRTFQEKRTNLLEGLVKFEKVVNLGLAQDIKDGIRKGSCAFPGMNKRLSNHLNSLKTLYAAGYWEQVKQAVIKSCGP